MAENIKPKSSSSDVEQSFDVNVNDLESTLQQYMDEDVEAAKKNDNLINPATMFGLAVMAVCSLAVMDLFLPLNLQLEGLLALIIAVGGTLMVLTGLGLFTRPPRKKKRPAKIQSVNAELDEYGLLRKKRLLKSRTNRRISGVCGGIAEYLGMDATMVRVLFVLFTFIGSGSPVIAYLALALILPKAPKIPN